MKSGLDGVFNTHRPNPSTGECELNPAPIPQGDCMGTGEFILSGMDQGASHWVDVNEFEEISTGYYSPGIAGCSEVIIQICQALGMVVATCLKAK